MLKLKFLAVFLCVVIMIEKVRPCFTSSQPVATGRRRRSLDAEEYEAEYDVGATGKKAAIKAGYKKDIVVDDLIGLKK